MVINCVKATKDISRCVHCIDQSSHTIIIVQKRKDELKGFLLT